MIKFDRESIIKLILKLDKTAKRFDLERMSKNELKSASFKLKDRW